MFKELLLVIKKDLSFHFTEEEQKLVDKMTDEDFLNFRFIMLERIRCCELPLDKLEDVLEALKKEEKKFYFDSMVEKDMEKMFSLDAELDRKCSKLFIAVIKGEASSESLLGSNQEEVVVHMTK